MKNIGIIPNTDKDENLETTRKLIEFITKSDCKAYVERSVGEMANLGSAIVVDDIYSEVDFLVILGGDGTILRVVQNASIKNIPIIGINLGTLGYLTDVEVSDSEKAIQKVLEGNYKREKRMMLETQVCSNGLERESISLALNDVCIAKSTKSKITELSIYINDEYIDSYRADGIIISTPTGSTAYNLSAGGPILKPDSKMIAITPICPHLLYARPLVVSSSDIIKIKPHNNPNGSAIISVDGEDVMDVTDEDVITIKKSEHYTTILKTNDLGFYDILRLKMVGEFRV